MDFICINIYNENREIVTSNVFIGLFTSVVYYQSIKLIPIIKAKVNHIIENSGFGPNSYSRKELSSLLELLPRDELFQISLQELNDLAVEIFSLLNKPKIKLFVRRDHFDNFLSCLVVMPRDFFSTEISEKVKDILYKDLGGVIASQELQVTNLPIIYIYTIINIRSKDISASEILAIEQKLSNLLKLWHENLKSALVSKHGEARGLSYFRDFKDAFPESYKEKYSVSEAIIDIDLLNRALQSETIIFDLRKPSSSGELGDDHFNLKIYSNKHKILLSDIMPILDNMGFKAIDEVTFFVELTKQHKNIWIHDFQLTISGYETLSISELKEHEILEGDELKKYVEEALDLIWLSKVQNDGLNKLILRASVTCRQVVLIRALGKYLRQTDFVYGSDYVDEVLTRHPRLVKLMIRLFYNNFDPNIAEKTRQDSLKTITDEIKDKLLKVVSSAEDKVIKRFFEIIKAIWRTNYFQLDNLSSKDYISFKFESAKIPELPLPRPFAEIFVYSPRVEGIHLRGGKVARGGLRWSDRSEDFRTEVLGLMKAQMTKNTVIVPVGSKGGFVVKKSLSLLGREDYLKEGKECYKIFLSGLLDVTDNIVNSKIVKPQNVVCYDEDDPYLVVAADKGTATFSDLANSVSEKYNFWLGDAFASGGSAGYDHKKMAITAKGAWISVQRHFTEINKNILEEDFSVIGIGDMSGDVFGNGMLLSKHIKLVGAFNHLHIFIDPAPEALQSYQERQRLFNLPTSNWTDYNKNLISKGGMIYERSAKIITPTPEIKAYFNIELDEITPDDLIKILLTSKVDLLWNGGIGTYVKSQKETNSQVGDKTNDALRINGSDLRCLVVGEGGNLGFTQLGRIEYSVKGGKINTDAIDNSAGVDCSDHEVNIKIALSKAVQDNLLTNQQRNKLLENMTDEVAELVLRDNKLQTQAITIAELQGASILEMNSRLINKLEANKILNREIEYLPSKDEILRRSAAKQGLTRPEIAVILAYSKITIYNDLIQSDLPDDPYFYNDLLLYFPKMMQENHANEITTHALRREIIATAVTNSMVNRIGTFFYHFAQENTGLKGSDVARAYTITRDAFELRSLWNEIENLDGKISTKDQVELFIQINKLLQRCIFWFLRNIGQTLDVSEIVNLFNPAIKQLLNDLDKYLVGKVKEQYLLKFELYNKMDLPSSLAKKLAYFDFLSSACDVISVANKNNLSVGTVAELYFKIGDKFNFDWLRVCIDKTNVDTYWEKLSLKSLKDDLYDQQRNLTAEVVKYVNQDAQDPLITWSKANQLQIDRYDNFINDLNSHDQIDSPMLIVAAKRVSSLVNNF